MARKPKPEPKAAPAKKKAPAPKKQAKSARNTVEPATAIVENGGFGQTENSNVSTKPARPWLKPWQPGQSGNPGGRQKSDKTIKALAREHTAEAIKTLADIMKDGDASHTARVSAATALLDRGHGKPLQQVEVGEAGAFSDLDDAELDRVIAQMGERLSALISVDEQRAVH